MRYAEVSFGHDRVGRVLYDGEVDDESGARVGHVDALGRVYHDRAVVDDQGRESYPDSTSVFVGRVSEAGEIEDRHREIIGRVDAGGDVFPGERGGSRIGMVGHQVPRMQQGAAALLLLLSPAAVGRP
jgi:hypothetical protein